MASRLTDLLTGLEDQLELASPLWLGVMGRHQSTDELWAVNEHTNKQWRFRVQMVDQLQEWVMGNMSPNAPVYKEINKKATPEGKRAKAGQYVVEHIALGKMLHPNDKDDPLFTSTHYEDESMSLQLLNGMYRRFRSVLLGKMKRIKEFETNKDPEVTWDDVGVDLPLNSYGVLQTLQNYLCDAAKIPRTRLGEGHKDIVTKMIGLVLRYQCMGAFDSTFHGSVPGEWGRALSGFTECFASPFNHKFSRYYSMFEQDKDFGSLGNFFVMLEKNNGVLPPGSYEINPPWMNAMYENLATVLGKTLLVNRVNVVLVAPAWKDTRWIPEIDDLCKGVSTYRPNSRKYSNDFWYVQDMTLKRFKQRTITWIFSLTPIPVHVFRNLGLA